MSLTTRSAAVPISSLLATVLAGTGCPPQIATSCQTDLECPVGFECRLERCVTPYAVDGGMDAATADATARDAAARDATARDSAAQDGAASDAPVADAPTSDAGPAPACGTIQAFADEFGDNDPGPYWGSWADSAAQAREIGGVMRFDFAPAPANRYAGFDMEHAVQLRDGTTRIELVDPFDAADAGGDLYFRFARGPDSEIGFGLSLGKLSVLCKQSGADCGEYVVGTFDPVLHRWWQMGERDGTVYFETSATGSSWTERHTLPRPPFAEYGVIQIVAGHWAVLGASESVTFDNFNANLQPGGWCPAATLSDNFDDVNLEPGWWSYGRGTGQIWESGSILQVEADDVAGSTGVESNLAYSIIGSSATVRVAQRPDQPSVSTSLTLDGENDRLWWDLYFRQDEVAVWGTENGVTVADNGQSSASAVTWLRFVHDGSQLRAQCRGDLLTDEWQTLATRPTSELHGAVYVGLRVSVDDPNQTTASRHVAHFEKFNLP